MADARDFLPSPGVSELTSGGGRRAVPRGEDSAGPAPVQRRRRPGIRPGEEPLTQAALEHGSRRRGVGQAPAGVAGVDLDVVELPLPTTSRRRSRMASWASADGETYEINMIDPKTNKLAAGTATLMLLMAIREMRLGGDPFTVMNAFHFSAPLVDANGKQLWPIVGEVPDLEVVLASQLGFDGFVPPPAEEEPDDSLHQLLTPEDTVFGSGSDE